MDESRLNTISQISAFLAGTLEVRFAPPASDQERYAHIATVAQRFGYSRLRRPDKGVVLRYLQRTSGYLRACWMASPWANAIAPRPTPLQGAILAQKQSPLTTVAS